MSHWRQFDAWLTHALLPRLPARPPAPQPDVSQVNNFVRSVMDFKISEVGAAGGLALGGYSILEFHIRGTAFLYHQVRGRGRAGWIRSA